MNVLTGDCGQLVSAIPLVFMLLLISPPVLVLGSCCCLLVLCRGLLGTPKDQSARKLSPWRLWSPVHLSMLGDKVQLVSRVTGGVTQRLQPLLGGQISQPAQSSNPQKNLFVAFFCSSRTCLRIISGFFFFGFLHTMSLLKSSLARF